MTSSALSIVDLREQPHFASLVASRVWDAWWRDKGVPLGYIEELVGHALTADEVPFTMVASRQGEFLGTVSVIENDMEDRPQYTPWVAAVWVEPKARNEGIGSALVLAAVEAAFRLGFDRLHLCAEAHKTTFYERLGWRPIERNVDGLDIFVMTSERTSPSES